MKDSSNRQNLLWVVGTPIGNRADMTPRARDALEGADFILCEDTRRGAKLLSLLEIKNGGKRLVRFDAHSSDHDVNRWVTLLKSEALLRIALITDAGTPGVSDPGASLVAAAHAAGVLVSPIPGPSAVTALMSVSGFLTTEFYFRGFFPRKVNDQVRELNGLKANCSVCIWFESPNRVVHALSQVAKLMPESQVVVGKELTKLHETLFFGSAVEVAQKVAAHVKEVGPLGEWVFALEQDSARIRRKRVNTPLVGSVGVDSLVSSVPSVPSVPEASVPGMSEGMSEGESDFASGSGELGSAHGGQVAGEGWVVSLRCLKKAGVSTSVAVGLVSREFGVPKNQVYSQAIKSTDGS